MSRLPTLEKRNGHVESVAEAFETEVMKKPVQEEKPEITVEKVQMEFHVMKGVDIGYPRQNVQFRLNSRQAKAMRHMLLGFETNQKVIGRRVNEQDMLRHIFDQIADSLYLQ